MILELENLTKRFGSRAAVQGVSLRVDEGEIFGLLGPNGAGKTTAIRMLLGLIRPDSGAARIAGFDCWRQHVAASRHVGAVLESPGLYAWLTARQHLRQSSRLLGAGDKREEQRLLEVVGLGGREDEPVKGFSLGMRQRLALAQALVGRPRLLVLDEPTNGLDPLGIHDLRELLRKLAREAGIAILLSSHLLGEVQDLCDRIAIMSHGFVRSQGRLSELLDGGGYRFELRAADVDGARRALRSISGLSVCDAPAGPWLELTAEDDVSELVTMTLVERGIGVRELRRAPRKLEEYFRDVALRGVAAG